MANGDLHYARFPVTLDVDAPADVSAQVGIANPLFLTTGFDVTLPEIIPITGGSGKSKAVVIVTGREIP